MKIGIGVCSYKRPALATRVCKQILDTVLSSNYEIKTICSLDDIDKHGYEWIEQHFGLIASPNKGIAINKNRLLNHLQDCDVIFLIEDDIQFVKSGWIDLYLNVIRMTNCQHLNFLTSAYTPHINRFEKIGEITLGYSQEYVNGVLMVFTKECLRRVGGFDIRFGTYGFEHVNYTKRCMKAGFHPPDFLHIMESSEYIHWSPTPSVISETIKEQLIDKSRAVFVKPIKSIFLPLHEHHQKIYFKFEPFIARLRLLGNS